MDGTTTVSQDRSQLSVGELRRKVLVDRLRREERDELSDGEIENWSGL